MLLPPTMRLAWGQKGQCTPPSPSLHRGSRPLELWTLLAAGALLSQPHPTLGSRGHWDLGSPGEQQGEASPPTGSPHRGRDEGTGEGTAVGTPAMSPRVPTTRGPCQASPWWHLRPTLSLGPGQGALLLLGFLRSPLTKTTQPAGWLPSDPGCRDTSPLHRGFGSRSWCRGLACWP